MSTHLAATASALASIDTGSVRIVGAPASEWLWHQDWRVYVGAGLALALIAGFAPWIASRLIKVPPVSERAFRGLARSLGLTSSERRLVRALAAAHGRALPVALLLSPAAFASARGGIPEGRMSRGDRKAAERLGRRLAQ